MDISFYPVRNGSIEAFAIITGPDLTLTGLMVNKIEGGGLGVIFPMMIDQDRCQRLFPGNREGLRQEIIEAFRKYDRGAKP